MTGIPTVTMLCRAYIAMVRQYRKPSTQRPTRTWRTVQSDLRHLMLMQAPPEEGMLYREKAMEFGELKATMLTPDQLSQLMRDMAATGTLSRNTINRTRATIIRMYEWACDVERRWCRSDSDRTAMKSTWRELRDVKPLKRGRTPAKESRKIPAASQIDMWQTWQEADHEYRTKGDWRMGYVRDITLVMYWSGMRPGEAVQLSLSSIDMTSKPWTFTPMEHKTEHHGKMRTIDLGQKARAALEERITAVQAEGRDWLFEARTRGGKPLGRPVSRNLVGQWLKALHERHSLTHYHNNQLRHGAATRIARSHGIAAASDMLGHSSITTTEIYVDPDREGVRKIAEEHC